MKNKNDVTLIELVVIILIFANLAVVTITIFRGRIDTSTSNLIFLGFWPLIIAVLGPILSTVAYTALKKFKFRIMVVFLCSLVVAIVLMFSPIGEYKKPEIKLNKQPVKTNDTFVFTGTILNYNPYRIITYFEKFSEPGKLHIAYPDRTDSKWKIGIEGSWKIELVSPADIKSVYFFLVREGYPAPDYVPNPEKIACEHWIKWGVAD